MRSELRHQQKSGYETSHKGKTPASEKEHNTLLDEVFLTRPAYLRCPQSPAQSFKPCADCPTGLHSQLCPGRLRDLARLTSGTCISASCTAGWLIGIHLILPQAFKEPLRSLLRQDVKGLGATLSGHKPHPVLLGLSYSCWVSSLTCNVNKSLDPR